MTWISVYWFSRAGPAATARTYYEVSQSGGLEAGPKPTIPTGYSFFPKEIGLGPRSCVQIAIPSTNVISYEFLRWYADKNLVFTAEHDHGGHFAAHEQPKELVSDLKKMFGKGGPAYSVVPGKDGYA